MENVDGVVDLSLEQQVDVPQLAITFDREAIARYGLTVRDVQDVTEAAVGGMTVSTAIAGRARFSINLRYAADRRSDPQALGRILVPVQAPDGSPEFETGNAGAGASRLPSGEKVAEGRMRGAIATCTWTPHPGPLPRAALV